MHALRSAVIELPPVARAKVDSLRVHCQEGAQCPMPSDGDGFLISNFRRRNAERVCARVGERPSTHREQLGGYDEAQTRNSALVRPESASCTHPLRC